jgi:Ecdysteroid kinase-like family
VAEPGWNSVWSLGVKMNVSALPTGPDSLSAEWITACLRSAGALGEGRVKGLAVERFAEGTGLLGLPVRVRLEYEGERERAPDSLIVKFPSEAPQNVHLSTALKFYWREHRFYTEGAKQLPVRTPRLYSSQLQDMSSFVLVLEDVRARPGNQIAGATAEEVAIAARHVAKVHAQTWGRTNADYPWVPRPDAPEIVGVVSAVTAGGVEPSIKGLPECFTKETEKLARGLPQLLFPLSAALSREPTALVHGDFRIDNLLFGTSGAEDELTVVDWQICYAARGPYDLAYLMSQSVPPDTRRAIEKATLETYHGQLVQLGVRGYSFDDCLRDYRTAMLYCFCYPLIVLGALDLANERGRALGRMMLDRSLSAIQDCGALEVLNSL